MTSYGDIKTKKRNVLQIPHLCLHSQKDFQQDIGHSSDLDQKQSGILLNGRPEGEWNRVAELMMIRFGESGHPDFRATSPLSRGTLKSKEGRKLSFHFCADGASSVSTEQSQTCVKSTVAVEQEQGDLLWQSNLIHISRQQIYW